VLPDYCTVRHAVLRLQSRDELRVDCVHEQGMRGVQPFRVLRPDRILPPHCNDRRPSHDDEPRDGNVPMSLTFDSPLIPVGDASIPVNTHGADPAYAFLLGVSASIRPGGVTVLI